MDLNQGDFGLRQGDLRGAVLGRREVAQANG
jgi:hypothetical protein